jgi:hypothetical protein
LRFQKAEITLPFHGPKEEKLTFSVISLIALRLKSCEAKKSKKENDPLKRKNITDRNPIILDENNFFPYKYKHVISKNKPMALGMLSEWSIRTPSFSINPEKK